MKYFICNNDYFYSGCCSDEFGGLDFRFTKHIKFSHFFDDIKDANYICKILNLSKIFLHFNSDFVVKSLDSLKGGKYEK